MSLAGSLLKRSLSVLAPGSMLVRGGKLLPRLALTFDDGPHPEHTPRILDALARAGATATFFLQGANAAVHRPIVRAIHAQGHLVANHASSHRTPSELGTAAYVREVLDTQALLDDIVGSRLPRRFRPPYGTTSVPTFARLAAAKFRFVYWSRDSRDSWLKTPEALLDDFARHRAQSGDIVLFHDDYRQTADALPQLLQRFQAQGLVAVSVEDLT